MSNKNKPVEEASRNEAFVTKASTGIWQEIPDEKHEYLATGARCFGYAQEDLLAGGYGITEMLFLLTRGELPNQQQRKLLDAIGVALSNPGPRHPATRAAMEAAVSKTRTRNLLPIALTVLSGDFAAGGVEKNMRFLRLNRRKNPEDVFAELHADYRGEENDEEVVPGFGPHFGLRETFYVNLAWQVRRVSEEALPHLDWCLAMDSSLQDSIFGLKSTGLAAAVFLDLGFHPRFGPSLYQFLSSPGLIAHGIEMSNRPFTEMPFVSDDNYHSEDDLK